ncbi:MAG: GxxExxY protein [Pyrinomonadaceae bacterium]
MTELVLKNEVYEIIGAALEVYWSLGAGLAEPIYQEAMGIELAHRSLPFEPQHELRIWYKERLLEKSTSLILSASIRLSLRLRAWFDYHRLKKVNCSIT